MWIINQSVDSAYDIENRWKIYVESTEKGDWPYVVWFVGPCDIIELGKYKCFDDASDAVCCFVGSTRTNWFSFPDAEHRSLKTAREQEEKRKRERSVRLEKIQTTVTTILLLLTLLKLFLG